MRLLGGQPQRPRGRNRFRIAGYADNTNLTWDEVCPVAERNATLGFQRSICEGSETLEQFVSATAVALAHWKYAFIVHSRKGVTGAPCIYNKCKRGGATTVFNKDGSVVNWFLEDSNANP